jgi:hypothetical protein
MKIFLYSLAGIVFLAGILLGLYVALYLCLICGIIQVIHACQINPISASGIAFGAVRILCTSIAGWIAFLICTGGAAAIAAAASAWTPRSKKQKPNVKFGPATMNGRPTRSYFG